MASLFVRCSFVGVMCMLFIQAASKAPLPLPPFIKACHRSDPDFKACALKRGREALPQTFEGLPKYRVPKLDPFKVEKLEVDGGDGPVGLSFTAKDCNIYGVRDARLDDLDIDLKKLHVECELYDPRVEMICQYNATGKVLLLPIQGVGTSNITVNDLHLKYSYDIKSVFKDNIEYYVPDPNTVRLDFNTSRLYINLDNLFNGDKLLGETTNRALNENWKDVLNSLGPVVSETLGQVATSILTGIFELVPQTVAFPE